MRRAKLEDRLLELVQMKPERLHEEWTKLTANPAPNVPAGLLRRFIAQRLQEKRHRGLPVLVSRELDDIAGAGSPVIGKSRVVPAVTVRPGTRLMREWNGQTISVTAVESGFEYNGKHFGSLTHIASEVTGTHQSGPRFFGLTKRSTVRG